MDHYNPNKAAWIKKGHRRTNLFNPTFSSQLITDIFTQNISRDGIQSTPKHQPIQSQQALEKARHQFEHKQIPNSQSQSPHSRQSPTNNKDPNMSTGLSRDRTQKSGYLRNPLVYEYELKRAAYHNSLQNQRNSSLEIRPTISNMYSFNNDTAIYKKQAKDFNIISLMPEQTHGLREHQKLSTENKKEWHLESNYQTSLPTGHTQSPINPQKV